MLYETLQWNISFSKRHKSISKKVRVTLCAFSIERIDMYLGLDLGTSSLKGLLITKDQEIVGTAEHNYSVQNPAIGLSEQNPKDWLVACERVLESLSRRYPSKILDLKGIGISGQMHGAILIDKNDDVILSLIHI